MKIEANGIPIEVEDSGGAGPAVLLIMGLGMQLITWPPAFVQALVDAGYRVLRHDNRDAGKSRHFHELGVPNLLWEMSKAQTGFLPVHAPYRLADMAQDALGVLDARGIGRAHVIGASMGGMIAQRLALAAPDRLLSLTSIMSSSGAPGLPGARADVLRALFSSPRSSAPEHLAGYLFALYRLIASPGFPTDAAELQAQARHVVARGYSRAGSARQLLAVAADSARARLLRNIRTPTLVLHGRADPLVPMACGHDTAHRIPGARWITIDAMGHDLAPGLLPRLLEPITAHLAANDARPATSSRAA